MIRGKRKAEHLERWLEHLVETKDYLEGIDIEERYRKTLKRCVDAEYETALESKEWLETSGNDGKSWTQEEVDLLVSACNGPLLRDWAEQDERMKLLSHRLMRSAQNIRRKALSLGKGYGVDYWLVKIKMGLED